MTTREKTLVSVLPALVIVAGYVLLLARGKLATEAELRRSVAELRSQIPDEEVIREQERRYLAMVREADEKKKATTRLVARCLQVGGFGQGMSRPERIGRVKQILLAAGLHVVDESDVEGQAGGAAFPTAEAMSRLVADLTENPQPRPRVIRFLGRYPDVTKTLQTLAQGDIPVIPLGLTMKSLDGDSPLREWTLLLWI